MPTPQATLSPKITPFLWFNGQAEEAARFYVSLFENSAVTQVTRYGAAGPGPEGSVMTVAFRLAGHEFVGLNGGPNFKANEAVSFMVLTDDQDETDRYWNAIVAGGGQESACGWCKDRWGFSRQITPRVLLRANSNPDRAAAKRAFEAMTTMRKIDIARIEADERGEAIGG